VNDTKTPRTDKAEVELWSDDGLRSEFIVLSDFARELEREIARLTAERDEARRIACLQSCMGDDEPREWSPEDFAKQHGWDCFREDGK
jgi:hypothetical protein